MRANATEGDLMKDDLAGVSESLELAIVLEDGGDGWIVASIPQRTSGGRLVEGSGAPMRLTAPGRSRLGQNARVECPGNLASDVRPSR
jgi:hypothetical protein